MFLAARCKYAQVVCWSEKSACISAPVRGPRWVSLKPIEAYTVLYDSNYSEEPGNEFAYMGRMSLNPIKAYTDLHGCYNYTCRYSFYDELFQNMA